MDLVPFRRLSPFGGLSRLQDEMNDLFGRFFGDWGLGRPVEGVWAPAMEVSETDDAVIVRAELPGVNADDVDISVHHNMLTLSGEKKSEEKRQEGNAVYTERRYGSFRREMSLPADVDADHTSAQYKDGVLTITLPKSEQAKPRKVTIKK